MEQQELLRYSRHFLLPEIGLAGQERLLSSRVLIVGAGGLGCPAALYLAAAGVGRISLMDFDRVELSNLQRQILFSSTELGAGKAEAGVERLRELNPGLELRAVDARLDAANALPLFREHDLVVDATDSFQARYLVNDAALLSGRQVVSASVLGFEGQISIYGHPDGPCLRCLYPLPPPPGRVPSCGENGVLGAVPGVLGALQAGEAVKLLLGLEGALVGSLLHVDLLRMEFRKLSARKNPGCLLCGQAPMIRELRELEAPACDARGVPELGPREVSELLKREPRLQLLDVREPHELEICRLPSCIAIPLGQLVERRGELDPRRPLVIYCRSGMRSATAALALAEYGFRATNMTGGILAWSDEVDPSVPKY